MSDITRKDDLIKEKCADVLITLQNIASTNYRSAYNLPFYMDKAKEIERIDGTTKALGIVGITKALSELEDIWKHPRKYKNIIHVLNAVYESSEAVKRNNIVEQNRKEC